MKFKKNAKTVHSSDYWYDLTDGGYIKPDELLEKNDAQEVKEAINTIIAFFEQAENEGFLEEI